MVLMGKKCRGIEDVVFRQLILCSDRFNIVTVNGEEQVMVNSQVCNGYLTSAPIL
jgi:hypothetical protein